MSMPLPQKSGEAEDLGEAIEGRQQLLDYFASGEKPRKDFKVGTEHEKFGFLRESREPLPYEGPRGIETILAAIAEDHEELDSGPVTVVREPGGIIGLHKKGASVTLEPGGQLELSGAPLFTVQETCREVGIHLRLLQRICKPLDVGFIGIGFHPTASYDEMANVPKGRYSIMRKYMQKVGSRGLDMMKRTCTVQANFDFSSEADMALSMRLGMAVSPFATAIFANSPFKDGALGERVSERAYVWRDTDLARSGFVDAFLEDGFTYEAYLDYVLDVPMYFIRRDGLYHDYAGASFREFITNGFDGHVATMRDFEDHLTVAFPEARLKKYIEVRGADCGPWSRICALPAFWKGLMYDEEARGAALELIGPCDAASLWALHADVVQRGYRAQFGPRSVQDIAQGLLQLSAEGLGRQGKAYGHPSEAGFIDDLIEEAERGETFADKLAALYRGEWGGRIEPLYQALEFFSDNPI